MEEEDNNEEDLPDGFCSCINNARHTRTSAGMRPFDEVDIADLTEILATELPEDLELVYENLLKGSYNHLDAFQAQLDK